MSKLASTFLTVLLSLNLAFGATNSDEIYGEALASVHKELSGEKIELERMEKFLDKLNSDLNSAKIKRNVALGVGIPLTIFAGFVAFKSFSSYSSMGKVPSSSSERLSNVFPRLMAWLVGAGATSLTAGSAITTGTLVYLSQSHVNEIKESIRVLKIKIQIKKKLVDQQLDTISGN